MSKILQKHKKNLHKLFVAGLVMKGIDGILETIGGILLLFLDRAKMSHILVILTQHELFGLKHDFIAQKAWEFIDRQTFKFKLFEAIYLLGHGLVKLVLVWGLLKGKLLAYKFGLVILSGFVIYQTFRWFHTHSIVLLFLTIFDIIIIFLVWREYNEIKLNKKAK